MKVEGGLIIHLARAAGRRPGVDRLLADCPVPLVVLDAVDGRAADADMLAAYDPDLRLAPRYPFALLPAEVACFLSHRAAWARILAEGWDAGLVVEDDAALVPDTFVRALELVEAHPGDGAIQLQTRGPQSGVVIASKAGLELRKQDLPPLRTTCSIYSRSACERLLEASTTFDRPVDVFLQMHWVTGVHVTSVYPSGVSEVSGAGGSTTIQKSDRKLWSKLTREIRRPLFRSAMARRARR
ncbi:glycosyltransferase family 25 protein [Jannaschia sp. 2305UL9-9]|uniref:glycosyltransferase family 25 protein n=1 Tax=Jannaschia sp. 2305UL9-9 TaxID=3121638 RepID=UPI0035271528